MKMTKIMIINGPNINMLGIREPNIYGHTTYDQLCSDLYEFAKNNNIDLTIQQSNHEGDLIDYIQSCYFNKFNGIVINPGAYTHTSIGILDALISVNIPTIEVHISDITKREEFRRKSYVSLVAKKTIMGMGIDGYFTALKEFIK